MVSINGDIFFFMKKKPQDRIGSVLKKKENQNININSGNSLIVSVHVCACAHLHTLGGGCIINPINLSMFVSLYKEI